MHYIFTRCIAVCLFALVLFVAQQTTAQSDKNVRPGNPDLARQLDGVWKGEGQNWEQTFSIKIVDGNRVVGWQQSCRLATGECSVKGDMTGVVVGDTIRVTVEKGKTYEYTLAVDGDVLINQGILLKKM